MAFDVISWDKIDELNEFFVSWKTPWTADRALKLDKLDSVADQVSINSVKTDVASVRTDIGNVKTILDKINGEVI